MVAKRVAGTSPRRGGSSVGTLELAKASQPRKKVPVSREYVGIDLHRRRSVIVRKNADGELLSKTRIVNEPAELVRAVEAAGPEPEVVLEATFGWYWAADLLAEMGAHVHLAHPLGNNWGNRRVKNDERAPTTLLTCCASGVSRRRGSPRRRSVSCASWSATGRSWCGSAPR